MKNLKRDNAGFTLVELLVVIAIIRLLASIVLIFAKSAKEKAKIAKIQIFHRAIHSKLGAYSIGNWYFEDDLLDNSGNNIDMGGFNYNFVNGASGNGRVVFLQDNIGRIK